MSEPELETASDPAPLPPPRSPGAQLLAERRSQGLSLGDIARQLKLSVKQVEALERDEYGSFPGSVFVRGFLRNYAKLLRLDPDRLLEAAGASVAPVQVHAPASTELQVPAANPELRRRILTWGAVVGLGVVVLILLASNASKEQRDAQVAQEPAPLRAESPPPVSQAPVAALTSPTGQPPATLPTDSKSVAEISPAVASAPTVESTHPVVSDSSHAVSSDATPEETVAPAKPRLLIVGSGSSRIHMIFEDESWVEVRDGSGATIFSRLNAPGTERVVRGMPPFVVVVGNAHRVKLMYQDKPVDLNPHTRVDVARITLE